MNRSSSEALIVAAWELDSCLFRLNAPESLLVIPKNTVKSRLIALFDHRV